MADRVRLQGEHWIADYTLGGKRKQNRVSSEAEGWELIQRAHSQAVVDHDQQQRTGIKKAPPAPTGGFSVAQAWELSYQRRFKGQASVENTQSHYKKIRSYFGPNTQLDAISAIWLDQFRQELLATTVPKFHQHISAAVSAKTVNRVVSVLRAMRSDAITFGRLINVPTWPKQLTETKIPPRFLSGEEVDTMLTYWAWKASAKPHCTYDLMIDFVQFRLCQGSRFGESVRVTPRDVNKRTGDVTFVITKNGSPRTVPLLAVAMDIVKRRSEGLGCDDQIFPIRYSTFQRQWAECRDALGLGGRVVPHVLRHTMATRAISANVSTAQLMHFGGWRSLSALDHYSHIDTQGLQTMKQALESY